MTRTHVPDANAGVPTSEFAEQQVTRETLYAAVWRTPMRTLARRFGCSDRGLAKACERFQIPVPPRGYWAKLAVGQHPPRPALPNLTVAAQDVAKAIYLPTPSRRTPEAGTVAEKVRSEVAAPERRITVRETLHGAHPLIALTRERFEAATADDRGILHPDGRGHIAKSGALAIHVSKSQVHRALRVFDALLKAIESNGWTVRCPAKSENRGTGVTILGEEIPISIEEKVKRFDAPKKEQRVTKGHSYDIGRGPYATILVDPYPRWIYEPLGQLALRVPGISSHALQIADGSTQRIEDRLDEFLVGVVRLAEKQLERRRYWAEQERLREDERRRQHEVAQRKAEEAARLESLIRDASAWRRAEEIRGYIAALCADVGEHDQDLSAYAEWALEQASQMDPVARRQKR